MNCSMNIHLRYSLVLLLMLLATTASASKIGFVDVPTAIASTEQGKAALEEFNRWTTHRQQAISALLMEASRLQTQVEELAEAGNQENLDSLQKQVIDKKREYEDAQRNYPREEAAKRNQLFKDIANRLNDIVTEFAEENGFDAIFIMKDQMVLHLSDSVQLTDDMIRIYDLRYPATSN